MSNDEQSTHPLVRSIETEGPVETRDYESQWITKSKTPNQIPLHDVYQW